MEAKFLARHETGFLTATFLGTRVNAAICYTVASEESVRQLVLPVIKITHFSSYLVHNRVDIDTTLVYLFEIGVLSLSSCGFRTNFLDTRNCPDLDFVFGPTKDHREWNNQDRGKQNPQHDKPPCVLFSETGF